MRSELAVVLCRNIDYCRFNIDCSDYIDYVRPARGVVIVEQKNVPYEMKVAFYNAVVEQQLRLLPKRNCPKLLEKEKQTWLFLPEGITVNGDYEIKAIDEYTYVTRKEWRN